MQQGHRGWKVVDLYGKTAQVRVSELRLRYGKMTQIVSIDSVRPVEKIAVDGTIREGTPLISIRQVKACLAEKSAGMRKALFTIIWRARIYPFLAQKSHETFLSQIVWLGQMV